MELLGPGSPRWVEPEAQPCPPFTSSVCPLRSAEGRRPLCGGGLRVGAGATSHSSRLAAAVAFFADTDVANCSISCEPGSPQGTQLTRSRRIPPPWVLPLPSPVGRILPASSASSSAAPSVSVVLLSKWSPSCGHFFDSF